MTDETVVEADGIRVTKSFDAEGFPVPAVRFDVTSERDEESELTITDEIPAAFDIDQIGFHPEYGSEHWTATGDGVVRFERTVEPGDRFTTVYGVRMGADQEPTAFLDAPTVTVGDDATPTGIDDVIPPESSAIVRELAGGERDTVPGLEPDADTAAEATPDPEEPLLGALHGDDAEIVDAEAADAAITDSAAIGLEAESDTPPSNDPEIAAPAISDPVSEPEAQQERDEEAVMADTNPATGTDTAAVATTLADQLRNDDVAEDDLAVLRDALAPRRSDVQLEHLQSRISEMEAYADALGAFIDENGDARGLLSELESSVDAMQDDLASVDKVHAEAAADRDAIRESLAASEERIEAVDDLEARADRIAGDVDALDERVAGVEDTSLEVAELADEVAAMREELEEVKEWRSQLSDVFGA